MDTTRISDGRVLILRTCDRNLRSRGGFQYPSSGYVEAPDWDGGLDKCGGGLHGFLWGVGDGGRADWSDDAKWLVLSADPAYVVELTVGGGGKCKFRGGDVVFVGDRKSAADYLLANGAAGKAVIGATATAGRHGTATAGYGGILMFIVWSGEHRRVHVCHVGEDGVKPNVAYRYDAALGKAVEVAD